jgi:hypothetical protein
MRNLSLMPIPLVHDVAQLSCGARRNVMARLSARFKHSED